MMISIANFACPGKARHRGTGRSAYTPKKTVDAQRRIAWEWKAQTQRRDPMAGVIDHNGLYVGPVEVLIFAEYEPPKSWSKRKREAHIGKWKTTKPDLDNIEKLVTDALNGVAYVDDKQVVKVTKFKRYAKADRLQICVRAA